MQITDFERGQWCVIQTLIMMQDFEVAERLCNELNVGISKIKALQKNCEGKIGEEVLSFLKDRGEFLPNV